MSEQSGPELSAGDSPVRTFPTLESEPESTEREADSGASTRGSFAFFDHATSLWRTYQHSLAGGLVEFSETWPKSGMTRSGIAYPLLRSVPRIAATESGLPAPRAERAGRTVRLYPGEVTGTSHARQANGGHGDLEEEVARRMWPTPTASESTGAGHAGQGGLNLRTAVQKWPTPTARDWTPTARDWKDGSFCPNVPINGLLGRAVWPTPTTKANQGAPSMRARGSACRNLSDATSGGALNPTWVEWLMGFPLGWTDLSVSATPSSPK